MSGHSTGNAHCIANEIAWFRSLVDLRLKAHGGVAGEMSPLEELPPPALADRSAPYAEVVRRFGMGPAERLLTVLAFAPHVAPDALDPFFIPNRTLDRRFTEFGGVSGLVHGGFLPTAETGMFLLAGDDLGARLRCQPLFDRHHYLYAQQILRLDHRHPEEPPLSAALQVTPEYRERLASGRSYDPPFSSEFPAQRLTTALAWEDLVLDRPTRDDVEAVVAWVRHEHTLLDTWGLRRRLRPGYRSLFYGPPGTGKTLTASLLGQATGRPVYRIDLAKVVSKYVGETEKNLARLFDHAQQQRWILFFDEADSLFGQRTESRNSNDRAANQQVSYLLQRIEDFSGVVILATNLRSHLDEAFARRFQSMVYFPMPGERQRLRLWQEAFTGHPFALATDVDLATMARDHVLSGGGIANVLGFASLRAVVRDPPAVTLADLLQGIRAEFHKEGRFLGRGE
jgi:hypothetical protein